MCLAGLPKLLYKNVIQNSQTCKKMKESCNRRKKNDLFSTFSKKLEEKKQAAKSTHFYFLRRRRENFALNNLTFMHQKDARLDEDGMDRTGHAETVRVQGYVNR